MLKGKVCDVNGNAIVGATVALMNDRFENQVEVLTDKRGYFKFDNITGKYAFLYAVKDYKVNFLEYWATNVDTSKPIYMDIQIGDTEIYGLNAYVVKGAEPGIFVYFRPMSMVKANEGNAVSNIKPNMDNNSIEIRIDGKKADILIINEVKEYSLEGEMDAYLIHTRLNKCNEWYEIKVIVRDNDGNIGMASIYNNE